MQINEEETTFAELRITQSNDINIVVRLYTICKIPIYTTNALFYQSIKRSNVTTI